MPDTPPPDDRVDRQDGAGAPTASVEEGLDAREVVRASRSWWDREAGGYQAEHAPFLAGLTGTDPSAADAERSPADLPPRLVWGPEGLD